MLIRIFLLIAFSLGSFAYGHSGRTNSSGCHNDNINGGYHCHKGYEVKETKSTKKIKINNKKKNTLTKSF